MAKGKSPAFQFYPSDWLSSQKVKLMTNAERGMYVNLLSHDWLNHGLPLDMESLAKLADEPVDSFKKSWLKIRKCFFKKDGKFHNERLRQERRKQRERSIKMKLNAEKLWRPPSKPKHKQNDASGKLLASNRHSSSFSSSSSTSVTDITDPLKAEEAQMPRSEQNKKRLEQQLVGVGRAE